MKFPLHLFVPSILSSYNPKFYNILLALFLKKKEKKKDDGGNVHADIKSPSSHVILLRQFDLASLREKSCTLM